MFCPEDFSPFKPDPKIITNLKNKLNLNLSEIVYIGDMPIDRKFARLAGVDFIHASYGYGKKVKYGFSYTSINNKKFLSVKNIKQVLKKIIVE